jgi:pyruvate/2-oxoglutarate dehydrogenase complex dihydrolipoamide dehydrogenase (E3) component
VDDLEEDGVVVRTHSEVTAVELLPSGQKKVTLNHKNEVVVDTILVAIGRDPTTH